MQMERRQRNLILRVRLHSQFRSYVFSKVNSTDVNDQLIKDNDSYKWLYLFYDRESSYSSSFQFMHRLHSFLMIFGINGTLGNLTVLINCFFVPRK